MKIIYCKDYIRKNKKLFQTFSEKDLTPERRKRMEQLKDPKRKHAFLLAEFVTLGLLEELFHIHHPKILGKAGEKPFLEVCEETDKRIFFSRSYAGEDLVVAFEEGHDVGIDAESFLKRDPYLEEFFFTKKERNFLMENKASELVRTVIWTRKESFMKYCKEGLRFPFPNLESLEDSFSVKNLKKIPEGFLGSVKGGSVQKTENLCIRSLIISDTVVSVTGEPGSVENMFYQEK